MVYAQPVAGTVMPSGSTQPTMGYTMSAGSTQNATGYTIVSGTIPELPPDGAKSSLYPSANQVFRTLLFHFIINFFIKVTLNCFELIAAFEFALELFYTLRCLCTYNFIASISNIVLSPCYVVDYYIF